MTILAFLNASCGIGSWNNWHQVVEYICVNWLMLLTVRSQAWFAARCGCAGIGHRRGENPRLAGSAAMSPGRWCTFHGPSRLVQRSSRVGVPPRPVCPLLHYVRVGRCPTQVGCIASTVEVCHQLTVTFVGYTRASLYSRWTRVS